MSTLVRRTLLSLAIIAFVFAVVDISFPFNPSPHWSTVVYDRDGKILNTFLSKDEKWRMRCSIEQVDTLLLRTFIAKEDKYFYYHPGINPAAMLRAAYNNLTTGRRTSGASTITMQVVRLLEPRPRTIFSKLLESFRAFQLELHYSKNEILGYYLSLTPYGSNIEGVTAASLLYFGKAPALLSPAEAVTLTIIPNRPSSLRPGEGNKKLLTERNRWLLQLYQEGIIRKNDYLEAIQEPIEMKRTALQQRAPHLSRRLIRNGAGDAIYTTIKSEIQEKAQQLCYNHLRRLSNIGIHNGSILIIDNNTLEVVAYVGSQDYTDYFHSGQVDGITAIRSPGSTLKPLVYAMAFDAGVITPKTKLADVPVHYDGYSPENFDRKFHGQVSAEDALSSSLNIPAVVLLEKITVPVFRQRLLDAGCYSLRQQPGLGLSTILGGCGNTLEELTTLYTCFAREGSYMPIRYTHGKIPATVRKKIISPTASYLLSSILTRRDRPDLPNLFESSLHVPRIAWKTGTSYGRRDAWAIGYNKRYTVGVWIGNFDGKGIPELTGADMATPLLFQVFNSIDYNSTQGWFQPTRELDYRYICPQSGRIPGEHCSEKIIDAYLPGVSSTEVCDHLAEFKTDPAEKISYCTHCLPETGYKRGIYENPPAEVLRYYREQGLPVKIPPPHNPLCTRLFEGNKPRILSLKEGEEYLLEKEDPRPLELSAAVSGDVTTITWFINDQFYKTIPAGDKCFFAPHAGNTKISCTDDKGRNADIRITVTMY